MTVEAPGSCDGGLSRHGAGVDGHGGRGLQVDHGVAHDPLFG